MAGLPVVRTGDVALDRFLEAVRQYIETAKGDSQGFNSKDRVIRVSDLPAVLELAVSAVKKAPPSAHEVDRFVVELTKSPLFTALTGSGGAIDREIEGYDRKQIYAQSDSSAAHASTAEVAAVTAKGIAAQVTKVEARLNDFNNGQPGVVTLEEAYLAVANKTEGLRGQYTLKVRAGGAIAGIGLAATDSGADNATSSVIINADKFAVVAAGAEGVTGAKVPFYIDTGAGKIKFTADVVVDGDLLVGGTVTSEKIGTNTLNAVTIDTSGSVRATGSYTEGSFSFMSANFKTGGVFQTTGSGLGYYNNWLAGAIGYVPSGPHNAYGKFGLVGLHYIAGNTTALQGASDTSGGVVGVTDTGTGVYGYASGNGSGLIGHGGGASSFSLKLVGSGRVQWNGLTVSAPPNNTTSFLRADGNWTALENANYATTAGSSTYATTAGSAGSATNSSQLGGYSASSYLRQGAFTASAGALAGYITITLSDGVSQVKIPAYY